MFRLTQRPQKDIIEVAIGPRATFRGVLECDTSIQIEGLFDGGKIETLANVILTETAAVECDITAKTVSIRGEYSGVIHADRVELLAGSKISGELHVNSFFLDQDVLLNASLNVQDHAVDTNPALSYSPKALAAPIEEMHMAKDTLLPEMVQGLFTSPELTEQELDKIVPAHQIPLSQEVTQEMEMVGHRRQTYYTTQNEERLPTEEVKSVQPVLLKYLHRAKRKTLAHVGSGQNNPANIGSPVPA